MLADSILVIITQLQSIPKESDHRCCHSWPSESAEKKKGDALPKIIKEEDDVMSFELLEAKRKEMVLELLRPLFQEIKWDENDLSTLVVKENMKEIRLNTSNLDELEVIQCGEQQEEMPVDCGHSILPPLTLEERLQRAFLRSYYAVYPLS